MERTLRGTLLLVGVALALATSACVGAPAYPDDEDDLATSAQELGPFTQGDHDDTGLDEDEADDEDEAGDPGGSGSAGSGSSPEGGIVLPGQDLVDPQPQPWRITPGEECENNVVPHVHSTSSTPSSGQHGN
ncbi:MAG: hypothetical protein R3B70_13120 [Polyangiaceae bacterium]